MVGKIMTKFSLYLVPIETTTSAPVEVKKKSVTTVPTVHKAWETLQWNQPLNLIGRGMPDPLIHICEQCDLPILIYGRMVGVV